MDRRDRMARDGGWRGEFGSGVVVDEQRKRLLVPLDEFDGFLDSFDWNDESTHCAEGSPLLRRMEKLAVTINDEDQRLFIPFQFKYGVCGTCDGKGTHVNPSIDAHGISPEEFDDDPDFRDNYFSGMYDVACYECQGRRVVPELNSTLPEFKERGERRRFKSALEAKVAEDASTLSDAELYALLEMHRNDVARDLNDMYAEMAAERRMGA